jgi:hypothetical protein
MVSLFLYLNFGCPKVAVRSSPGIFIYKAGISAIGAYKILEADRYGMVTDELKQILMEAISSSLTSIS